MGVHVFPYLTEICVKLQITKYRERERKRERVRVRKGGVEREREREWVIPNLLTLNQKAM